MSAAISHESEIGRWAFVPRAPAPRLARHVLGYCAFEEETIGITRRRELPSGEVVMILGLGAALEMTYPDRTPEPSVRARSFVAGLHDTHCIVESPGAQTCIQVNLTPIGAHLLLGVAMDELTNRVVPIDAVLGREGDELVERLHAAAGWERRFELLDRALVRRLDRARPGSPDVAWAWQRLIRSQGRLPIGALCAELGCSRKHMLRRFYEQIGVAPKTYARVLRFQRAVHMLGHTDGASWVDERELGIAKRMSNAEIALECGYFDQAHMNRDFREFAGVSPGELAAALLPGDGGIAA